jgi:hypothetical protein
LQRAVSQRRGWKDTFTTARMEIKWRFGLATTMPFPPLTCMITTSTWLSYRAAIPWSLMKIVFQSEPERNISSHGDFGMAVRSRLAPEPFTPSVGGVRREHGRRLFSDTGVLQLGLYHGHYSRKNRCADCSGEFGNRDVSDIQVRSLRYSFSPNLFACNQLCVGVNRKVKWLVQGGKYRTMTPPCLDS